MIKLLKYILVATPLIFLKQQHSWKLASTHVFLCSDLCTTSCPTSVNTSNSIYWNSHFSKYIKDPQIKIQMTQGHNNKTGSLTDYFHKAWHSNHNKYSVLFRNVLCTHLSLGVYYLFTFPEVWRINLGGGEEVLGWATFLALVAYVLLLKTMYNTIQS